MRPLALLLLASCTADIFARPGRDPSMPGSGPSGTGGAAGTAGGGTEPEPVLPPFSPAAPVQRRLLGREYVAAISQLFGPWVAAKVRAPPDAALYGLDSVGAGSLSVTPAIASIYLSNADEAVKPLTDPATRDALIGCTPASSSDRACMERFVGRFARRAYRRPLEPGELARKVQLGLDAAMQYGDFHRGAAAVAWGVLQSVHFLYLVELGVSDGVARRRASGFELASRLSFLVVGKPPNDALLDAAAAGELDTGTGVRHHTAELLDRLDAHAGVLSVFDELYRLRELEALAKDTRTFPAFGPALARDMRDETWLLLRYFIFEPLDFRDVLDARFSFVTADLAQLYGLQGTFGAYLAQADFPAGSPRVGLLGQASVLALNAHPQSTSPTLRGRFVLERLLCSTVPPPPPDVDTTVPADAPSMPRTMRERLLAHRTNPGCSGCHTLTDDIGLSLENFDTFGRWRADDQGLSIDASGALGGKTFTGLTGLAQTLKADPRFTRCLGKSFFRAATGRLETPGEASPLNTAHCAFEASGFRLKTLLVELAASEAFRFSKEEVTP